MTALSRFPRFFVTSPSPCPYLPGKQERKIFTELSGPHAVCDEAIAYLESHGCTVNPMEGDVLAG